MKKDFSLAENPVISIPLVANKTVTWSQLASLGPWNVEDTANGNYGHGLNALDSVVAGDENIAIGTNALTGLTDAFRNIAIGSGSLATVTDGGGGTGAYNIAIGYDALTALTEGADNVVIGDGAGIAITDGADNTLIGDTVGQYLTSGWGNTVIGAYAFHDPGQTTFIKNTVIGSLAGDACRSNENIIIGYNVELVDATFDHQLTIGDAIYGHMSALTDIDFSGKNLTITGPSAFAAASVNQDGGDLILQGGQKATGGGTSGNVQLVGTVLQEFDFTSDVGTVADQDYVLWWDAPFAGVIDTVRTKSQSGTCTLTGKVNTTALGGTANSVSSTATEQAHSTSNTFVKGDKVLFTVSSNSSCLDMAIVFYMRRTA